MAAFFMTGKLFVIGSQLLLLVFDFGSLVLDFFQQN